MAEYTIILYGKPSAERDQFVADIRDAFASENVSVLAQNPPGYYEVWMIYDEEDRILRGFGNGSVGWFSTDAEEEATYYSSPDRQYCSPETWGSEQAARKYWEWKKSHYPNTKEVRFVKSR
jgi:hypothetical protein